MTVQHDRPPPSAFSRPLVVDSVPDDGLERLVEADADECAAVATEIGLPAVHTLCAHYDVSRLPGGRLRVEGEVRASITQICVVSLEPFESEVTRSLDVTFAAAPAPDRPPSERQGAPTSRRRRESEAPRTPEPVKVAAGDADPPDPIVDGRIDLGTLAVEFLTLALDIYPRKPGAHFSDVVVGAASDDEPSAFAALERLNKDRS